VVKSKSGLEFKNILQTSYDQCLGSGNLSKDFLRSFCIAVAH
jgi:hypothetical protein